MIICYLPPIKGTRKLHWCRLRFVLTAFLTILFSLVRRPGEIPTGWTRWRFGRLFDVWPWPPPKCDEFGSINSNGFPKRPSRSLPVCTLKSYQNPIGKYESSSSSEPPFFQGLIMLNFGGKKKSLNSRPKYRSVCSLFFRCKNLIREAHPKRLWTEVYRCKAKIF